MSLVEVVPNGFSLHQGREVPSDVMVQAKQKTGTGTRFTPTTIIKSYICISSILKKDFESKLKKQIK